MWIAVQGAEKLADVKVLKEVDWVGCPVAIHEDLEDENVLQATELFSGMRIPLGDTECHCVGDVLSRLARIEDAYGTVHIQNVIISAEFDMEKIISEDESC